MQTTGVYLMLIALVYLQITIHRKQLLFAWRELIVVFLMEVDVYLLVTVVFQQIIVVCLERTVVSLL